jgi:16S rRNA (cytosine1402-N4)-methyltransferase
VDKSLYSQRLLVRRASFYPSLLFSLAYLPLSLSFRAERLLTPDGPLCVISFHSLEDRIVKTFFDYTSGRRVPSLTRDDIPPLSASFAPTFSLESRKVIKPSSREVQENPRARSARLRVGLRTRNASLFPRDTDVFRIFLDYDL